MSTFKLAIQNLSLDFIWMLIGVSFTFLGPSKRRAPSKKSSFVSQSQAGFALSTLTLFLPIALAAVFYLHRQIGWTLIERQTEQICQTELASGLLKAGQSLEKLLLLNTQVRAAKTSRQLGIAIVAASTLRGDPVGISIGTKMIQQSEMALRGLNAAQKTLLVLGHLQLAAGQTNLRTALLNDSAGARDAQKRQLQHIQIQIDSQNFPGLAVRPSPASDPYPEYVLEDHFSERQELSAFWRMSSSATQEVKSWAPINLSKKIECRATLLERENRPNSFRVVLSKGKLFSKPWFLSQY